MVVFYIIDKHGKLVDAYEGEDCRTTAQGRVTVHNRLYPNNQWSLEETAE